MCFIKRLLSNNYRFKPEHIEYRRVFLLNAVLLSLFGVCIFYSIFNIVADFNIAKALVDIASSIGALIIFIYFHLTDNIKVASHIVVLLLLATLAAFFNVVLNQYYSFLWLAVFPPVVYFLLGRKNARLITLLFGVYLIYFFSGYKSFEPAVFDYHSIYNIAGAMISLLLLISYFELSRKEAADALNKSYDALKKNKEYLRLVLDSAAEGIFGIDLNGNCTFCNKACLELLGYNDEGKLLSKNMHALLSQDNNGEVTSELQCNILKTINDNERIHAANDIFRRADGSNINVEYYSYPQFEKERVVGAVITFLDISERIRNKERIIYLNNYDLLTGFYNRMHFEKLQKTIDNIESLPLSVIYADINGLKLTNDVFGHTCGDRLIKKCAKVIRKNCRKGDITARIGGDEFIVLLPKTDYEEATQIVDRMRAEIIKENVNTLECNMALGCETKYDAQDDIKRVIKNAEVEMYIQKTLYRKNYSANIKKLIMETLHGRSPREKEHSENVSNLSIQLGKALGRQDTEIKKLGDAGYLHDIGKIVLGLSVLNKETHAMTDAERFEKQQHTVAGFRILNLFDETMDLAEAVFSHHEYWDGTGYPKGLKGEEIPERSRIISIAEAYDYLMRDMSKLEVLEEINSLKGKRFDPKLTEVFISLQLKETKNCNSKMS